MESPLPPTTPDPGANLIGCCVVKEDEFWSELPVGTKQEQGGAGFRTRKATEVTSDAPQTWFVVLRDEQAAGRVIVPLKPFLKFNRRMDRQLARLTRRIRKQVPQLARRDKFKQRSERTDRAL